MDNEHGEIAMFVKQPVVRLDEYGYGGVAVYVYEQGELYATLSVCLPEVPTPQFPQFWLKDWSENGPIARQMEADGFIALVPGGRAVRTGYVLARLYALTAKGQRLARQR